VAGIYRDAAPNTTGSSSRNTTNWRHTMQQSASRMSRHMLVMVLCCLIPLAALTAIFVFKVPVSQTFRFGLTLICPLGMMLMMFMMGGHSRDHAASESQAIEGDSNATGSHKGGTACH
jgi:hypothetical protein